MITKHDIANALGKIDQARDAASLEKLRLHYLGRKGVVTVGLRSLKDLPAGKRAPAGKVANTAKRQIESAITVRQRQIQEAELGAAASKSPLDLTAPAAGPQLGHLHPVQELQKGLIQAFWQLGFEIAAGPEIENDWYNFEALNMPADHPARDMQDTFYLENGAVARTHTSPVQIRYMEKQRPPIRIVAPGTVYRNEDEDPTHIWAFHQMEGLVVDRDITLGDLKGTLEYMMRTLLGEAAEVKFTPSFFPYTEPSLEVHARADKHSRWIEMAGAGMVHPQVLANAGIDPKQYSGFAFGAGLERIAAIRQGVDDVRYFWRPNLKFLEQF